jgi:manganese transport protein
MPHNLYLHSSLVQTRKPDDLDQSIKLNTADTVLALMWAFFVNAAILIMAAAVFHEAGHNPEELQQAYTLLTPLLGGTAATLFAVALLASGQSSTITGTLAGQIVMEGFLNLRIRPWLRRLITRGLAIVPAVLLIVTSGGKGTVDLLVVSQVVLSMQLSFAIFPLVMFTSSREKMGKYANPPWLKVVAYGVCALIAGLNVAYLVEAIGYQRMAAIAAMGLAFSAWVRWGYKGK